MTGELELPSHFTANESEQAASTVMHEPYFSEYGYSPVQ
jgi:hypothetical protein